MDSYTIRETLLDEVEENLKEYPELLQMLLLHRGITTKEDAEAFLNPDYDEHVHDPLLMRDMEKAVERILQAIDTNERVVIYSDYDADGIPGGVILHDFFRNIGFTNFENYIPHRHEEGYGVHVDAIDICAKKKATCIITVDCGIGDTEAVARANEHGIDMIITDHHEPNGTCPDAYAILNPKQDECEYPEKMLCGAGVAYKLVQGLLASRSFDLKPGTEKWLLDMVGLATLSDMVPLTGENRVFAFYGLKVLRKSRRPGLKKLLRKLNINQQFLSEDDIGFMISPRINAASRMGESSYAFQFLASRDEVTAGMASEHLNKINDERKGVVASVVKEVKKKIENSTKDMEERKVIVMGNPQWRPSLLGLVANSLATEYARPVFLWGRDGGNVLKGSCRSDGETNLVALMETANDHFLGFGGHKLAGGFSVSHDKVHDLEDALVKAFEKVASSSAGEKEKTWIDKTCSLDEVNWGTYRHIEKCGPFGIGNPKPLFLFKDVVISAVSMFGKQKNHLDMRFISDSGRPVRAIGFFMSMDQFGETLKEGKKIDLIATMERSMFRNIPELRLRIVDIV